MKKYILTMFLVLFLSSCIFSSEKDDVNKVPKTVEEENKIIEENNEELIKEVPETVVEETPESLPKELIDSSDSIEKDKKEIIEDIDLGTVYLEEKIVSEPLDLIEEETDVVKGEEELEGENENFELELDSLISELLKEDATK